MRIFITAQEILVDHASYPTERIAANSHKFRPLGLGYANLGSLLMSSGLPYDSQEGRALAAAITSIMHGQAYLTSAEHAGHLGAFEGFAVNREPMLKVMEMHRAAAEAIDRSAPADLLAESHSVWADCLELGRKQGYRNSQVTVLAPTGTIAFMMDCDTTGIEPDIALVKYKQLAGGGMLKIVNRTVPMALRKLGYDEPVIRGILDYIDTRDTIEGAPGLAGRAFARLRLRVRPAARGPEHPLPGPSADDGRRAAVPVGRDLQDVQRAQRGDHRRDPRRLPRRLEARAQGAGDLSRRLEGKPAREHQVRGGLGVWRHPRRWRRLKLRPMRPWPVPPPKWLRSRRLELIPSAANQPRRERLPHTRRSLTHKFDIQGHEGYINVGFYPDGRPGELFITMAKEGSTIGGLMDVLGTAISIGLQYGVPLEVFVNKFAHSRFEPAGFTKNPDIPIAKSIADYIFRWLGMEFIAGYREANAPRRPTAELEDSPMVDHPADAQGQRPPDRHHRRPGACRGRHGDVSSRSRPRSPLPSRRPSDGLAEQERQFAHFQSDAPACDNCGALTVRCGTCYRCFNCGNSMGCS